MLGYTRRVDYRSDCVVLISTDATLHVCAMPTICCAHRKLRSYPPGYGEATAELLRGSGVTVYNSSDEDEPVSLAKAARVTDGKLDDESWAGADLDGVLQILRGSGLPVDRPAAGSASV